MIFTMIGLVSAMLFGVFFGSEGELPAAIQETVFWSLIFTGATLHGLQILYQNLCKLCHCWICHHGRPAS